MANKHKFTFYGKEEYLAKFKLRMEYHSLSQSEFFRACVEAVIDKEDIIEEFIESYKEDKGKLKQKKTRTVIKKERQQAEEMINKLGLGDDEIDNIFDIIAKEYPEL
jgi:hypothetical protein